MRYPVLLGYQWLTGLSDTFTGALLYVAPGFTLRMMGLHAPVEAEPYVAYIGAFVLSVGFSCLYGVGLVRRRDQCAKLEVVWLLTAFARAAVALYLLQAVVTGRLEAGWLTVAAFDGICALIQGVGLRRGWLAHVE